ncbi:MAG: 50S ribosomal protein L18e [DPANN group archaeon]|nr:50S ribosomal protein L18e [DPANN group archaeon]
MLKKLISQLQQSRAPIWLRTAEELARSTRNRRAVNLSRIDRNADSKAIILVPGKVLATGSLTKKISVAAWQFSAQAQEKIKAVGGNTMTIEELMRKAPKGEGVIIIG